MAGRAWRLIKGPRPIIILPDSCQECQDLICIPALTSAKTRRGMFRTLGKMRSAGNYRLLNLETVPVIGPGPGLHTT